MTVQSAFLKPVLALFLALTLICNPLCAYAWSGNGHKTIALIAQSQLTPATRQTLDRLLALEDGGAV